MTRGAALQRVPIAVFLLLALAGCSSGSESPAPSSVASGTRSPFGSLPPGSLDGGTASRLQRVLDATVKAGSPDAIAAVVTADGIWTGASGIDGPDGRRASPEDVFAIASISKTFTAALIMRLVDDGEVDLDKPLSTYLGSLETDTNSATVRDALAMRSGIPDTSPASLAKLIADPLHVWTAKQVLAEFPKATASPGSEFIYSNPTYKLLGFAAESVSGSPLPTAMRSAVLDPAGSLESLSVQSAESTTPKPWALPIAPGDLDIASYGAGGALPSLSDATFSLAASGMASDAKGLASWGWQLFAGKVISMDSLQTMMTVDSDGNGLGLDKLADFGSAAAFGHGGSKDGYQSLLAIFPDRQQVIVVFVNQRDADVSSIASQLLDAAAREGRGLGGDATAASPPSERLFRVSWNCA
jgi:D-alanyl-D-alanine carboxypeptidase